MEDQASGRVPFWASRNQNCEVACCRSPFLAAHGCRRCRAAGHLQSITVPGGISLLLRWAKLDPSGPGRPEADTRVHKAVLNVGRRPTFVDGEGLTVEVHVLHLYGGDFYGEHMKVLVAGYLR